MATEYEKVAARILEQVGGLSVDQQLQKAELYIRLAELEAKKRFNEEFRIKRMV